MWTFLRAQVDISAAQVDISVAQVDISAGQLLRNISCRCEPCMRGRVLIRHQPAVITTAQDHSEGHGFDGSQPEASPPGPGCR